MLTRTKAILQGSFLPAAKVLGRVTDLSLQTEADFLSRLRPFNTSPAIRTGIASRRLAVSQAYDYLARLAGKDGAGAVLAKTLKEGGYMCGIIEIGAGVDIASQAYSYGGASRWVAHTASYYNEAVRDRFLGKASKASAVSAEMAEELARHAMETARAKAGENKYSGLGLTAAIQTDRMRRGQDHFYLSLCATDKPSLTLHGSYLFAERRIQQVLAGRFALAALAEYLDNNSFSLSRLRAMTGDLMDLLAVDQIKVQGETGFENICRNIGLVQTGLSQMVVFDAGGKIANLARLLPRREDSRLILYKGSFNPPTDGHAAVIEEALRLVPERESVLLCPEISTSIVSKGSTGADDLAHRVAMLNLLGLPVMVTNQPFFFNLAELVRERVNLPIDFVCGTDTLARLLEPRYYRTLFGGLREATQRLFSNETRMLAADRFDPKTGQTVNVATVLAQRPKGRLAQKLLPGEIDHQRLARRIIRLPVNIPSASSDERKRIKENEKTRYLPPAVEQYIKEKDLYK